MSRNDPPGQPQVSKRLLYQSRGNIDDDVNDQNMAASIGLILGNVFLIVVAHFLHPFSSIADRVRASSGRPFDDD